MSNKLFNTSQYWYYQVGAKQDQTGKVSFPIHANDYMKIYEYHTYNMKKVIILGEHLVRYQY
jgi:hypothetical protein